MKKTIATLCVLQLCLAVPCAQAMQIFDFSFNNFSGNTAGPIAGYVSFNEIGDFVSGGAESVVITGVGGHSSLIDFSVPIDVIAEGWSVHFNEFTVASAAITEWNFFAVEPGLKSVLGLGSTGSVEPLFDSTVRE